MCRVQYMTGEIACAHRGKKKPEKESEVIPEDDSFGRRIIDLRTLAHSEFLVQSSWIAVIVTYVEKIKSR